MKRLCVRCAGLLANTFYSGSLDEKGYTLVRIHGRLLPQVGEEEVKWKLIVGSRLLQAARFDKAACADAEEASFEGKLSIQEGGMHKYAELSDRA